jgi:hypothetical protein
MRQYTKTAGLICLLLLAATSVQAAKWSSVEQNPGNFADLVIMVGVVEPVFLYCHVDIMFGNANSDHCAESKEKLNRVAKAFSIIPIAPDDDVSLRGCVKYLYANFHGQKDAQSRSLPSSSGK